MLKRFPIIRTSQSFVPVHDYANMFRLNGRKQI